MPCNTCTYWHSDEELPADSIRGFCRCARAETAGKRTVYDYSCREHSKRRIAVLRKCKKCDWLAANDTYSLCHACGGELQEYELPQLKIRPTPFAPDKSGLILAQAEPAKEVSSPVESEPL